MTQFLDLNLEIHSGANYLNLQSLLISPMSIGAASIGGAGTLGGIDVSTQAGALAALDVTDDAIEQILQGRARVGAGNASLDHALDLSMIEDEQMVTSRSRIMDADVANESTEMVQAQIRTETGSAAIAHQHAQAARMLDLVTINEYAVPTGIPQSSGGAVSGLQVQVGGGSGTPAGFASGSGTPNLGGLPGSGGFAPAPVLNGSFQPMPVVGSGGGGGGSTLSTGQMMNMIAGSLA